MFKVLLVGAGGFVGSVLRYSMSGLVHRMLKNAWFPYGTLTVNLLGCFLIGFFNGLAESKQIFYAETRLVLFIGVLGGFTTFSTFSYESFSFLRDGQLVPAFWNVIIHVVFGLSAVYFGDFVSRLF
ncbi:fluoride efflux transporter CrcB [candidate division KSB1 bacterium]|nr:fluoride efflux transporter CrcB [candidate division KSB1 bacterium]